MIIIISNLYRYEFDRYNLLGTYIRKYIIINIIILRTAVYISVFLTIKRHMMIMIFFRKL